MAKKREQPDLVDDSDSRWNQYKTLQIASLFSFILIFIPVIGVFYIIGLFIASIIITVGILGFLKTCSKTLN